MSLGIKWIGFHVKPDIGVRKILLRNLHSGVIDQHLVLLYRAGSRAVRILVMQLAQVIDDGFDLHGHDRLAGRVHDIDRFGENQIGFVGQGVGPEADIGKEQVLPVFHAQFGARDWNEGLSPVVLTHDGLTEVNHKLPLTVHVAAVDPQTRKPDDFSIGPVKGKWVLDSVLFIK